MLQMLLTFSSMRSLKNERLCTMLCAQCAQDPQDAGWDMQFICRQAERPLQHFGDVTTEKEILVVRMNAYCLTRER